MFSEETDWLLPLPAGGLEGAVLPGRRGRRTSAAPRTAAGSTSRTCAGSCASSPSTAACARPSGRGGCCSGRCACAALRLPRRARRALSRRRALPRLRRRRGRCSRDAARPGASPARRPRHDHLSLPAMALSDMSDSAARVTHLPPLCDRAYRRKRHMSVTELRQLRNDSSTAVRPVAPAMAGAWHRDATVTVRTERARCEQRSRVAPERAA